MKNLKIVLLVAFIAITSTANATNYVIIKMRLFGVKLEHVSKPKNLDHWKYDRENDVYYSVKDMAGMHHPIPLHISDKPGASKYVNIETTHWGGGLKVVHVGKPGSLNKWHHDDKTDIYYHIDKHFMSGLSSIK